MTPRPHAETYLASRLRLAWCGPSLLVLDLDGGCGRHGLSGLFFREARHLSTLRLEPFGEEPHLASMARVSPRRLESTFLHPPVAERRGGGTGSGGSSRRHGVLARGLYLTAAYRVRPARLELRLAIAARGAAVKGVLYGLALTGIAQDPPRPGLQQHRLPLRAGPSYEVPAAGTDAGRTSRRRVIGGRLLPRRASASARLGGELVRIEGGKHFVPEDHPAVLATAVREVVAAAPAGPGVPRVDAAAS